MAAHDLTYRLSGPMFVPHRQAVMAESVWAWAVKDGNPDLAACAKRVIRAHALGRKASIDDVQRIDNSAL